MKTEKSTMPTKTAHLEVKKMKQGMSYSGKEKTIILNVFKYFRTQYPNKCVTELVRRTAKATGCSEKSIFQFRKEETSPEGFREPSKTKERKNMNINSRFIKYDLNVRHGIKAIILELRQRNIVPTLSTILKNVHNECTLPNFSIMTLRRLLFDMGFYYEKDGNKSVLVEKSDVKVEKNYNKTDDNGGKVDSKQTNPVKREQAENQSNTVDIVRIGNVHSVPQNSNNTVHDINHYSPPVKPQPGVVAQPQSNVHFSHPSNLYIQNQHIPVQHHAILLPQSDNHHNSPNNLMAPMPNPTSVQIMFDHHHRGAPVSHHPLHRMAAPNMDMHLRKDIGGIMHHPHHSMMHS